MAKKIFLSPSNQTENSYAFGGTNEAVVCGKMADAAKEALERCGFSVRMNHLGSLEEKVAASNSWGADLHIPIHTNAYNKQVSGTRMFYYSEGSNSYNACKAIYDVLAPLTPGTSENMKAYPSLYEMRKTTASSVYIEVDFHDVTSTAKWLIEHTKEVGEAICRGVCNFYGVSYIAPSGTGTAEIEIPQLHPTQSDKLCQVVAWKNGSTSEPVYADTAKKKKIGSLNPWETCDCLGTVGGMYIVKYLVDGTNTYKVGVVEYHGGVK